jgi:hypothetical protein
MRLVVCHDAGGAELVSSWLRRHDDGRSLYVLAGPARRIFERKLGPVPVLELAEGIARANSLLCGSSWQSTLEIDAIDLARARGLASIVYLDHWINYRERFGHPGVLHLPDALWVADDWARGLAAAAFPGLPVEVAGNPYFEDIRAEAAGLPAIARAGAPLSVLYACEPVSDFGHMSNDPRAVGYDEHEALAFFLRRLDRLGSPVRSVLVRPHPAEPAGKYDWAIGFHGLPVAIGGRAGLLEEIGGSDVVAGAESMALVVGLLANRRVVSAIPPAGRACVLPFPEIERIRD